MAFTKSHSRPEARENDHTAAVMRALAHDRRRTTLDVLPGLSPTSREDLAAHVAAHETQTDRPAVGDPKVRRVGLTLHHRHLPPLEDAGFVEYSDDTVEHTDTAPDDVLEVVANSDDECLDWSALFGALRTPRNRAVLAAVAETDGATDCSAVADVVHDHLGDASRRPGTIDAAERHIHHTTLPKFDATGLLSYHPQTGTVACDRQDDTVDRLADVLAD